jgi:DNA processing protein
MFLSDEEKINALRLMMSENVGPATYNQLIKYYRSATEAIKHIDELAKRGGHKKTIKLISDAKVQQQFEIAEKENVKIVFSSDKEYPENLRHLSDASPILFVKGNIDILKKKSVSVVGTRNASLNGKSLARKIANDLSEAGYNVVSGMAHGIDRAAHVGALASSNSLTTVVLGTAINEIYPTENQDIYQKLSEKGCLISEFPFGSILSPRNFPRRNRLIAGISLGTLVIEAQEKSGSLITAHFAADYGREVFAVPGSPVDPRSSGPNALIREGATLVSNAQDIIFTLENMTRFTLKETMKEDDYQFVPINEENLKDARTIVMNNLGPDFVSVDNLIHETGLDARLINIILVELELAGRLERHTGNRVSLIYNME